MGIILYGMKRQRRSELGRLDPAEAKEVVEMTLEADLHLSRLALGRELAKARIVM